MLTDIEIAQQADIRPIAEIAAGLGIDADELEMYGRYKAKLSEELIERLENNRNGKLILVTAINPTPAGEGKTTTSVGLVDGMRKIGKKAIIALREPSLGPVFGVKGGAAGGGYAQVIPMEDINLHFTGDIHAVTAANNLLCALVDNHIQQGNEKNIDPRRICVRRCMDMNDRELRFIIAGLGGKVNGVPREDGFVISVASEVMAILCLADGIADLKERLGRILVGYTYSGEPVFASDVNAQGAMTALLKDAIKPNMVQTLEGSPALMHGGPFANIAHGCNSVRATKAALKLADYCITEAGFGSDLGAEKFLDIKCRKAGLKPSAVVLVATVRALKYNGGAADGVTGSAAVKEILTKENAEALKAGMESNLLKHIENLRGFGLPVVVAINRFPTDTQAELDAVAAFCEKSGARFALSEVFGKGGEGGMELAKAVCEAAEQPSELTYTYDCASPLKDKVAAIATMIYGADGVNYTADADKDIKALGDMADGLPVCVAKTQYSLSDDPKKLGRPTNFKITVRKVGLSRGAGFVVVHTGDIMTMPGLPKKPAANAIDVDENGRISGLF